MMLVDPEHRGAGIGKQLMAHALSALKDVPCVGLDATPLGEPLYRRFGFETDYPLVRTKGTVDAARIGKPAGRARRMDCTDLAAVSRRDREVFGADRGELLQALFRRSAECAWIAKDGQSLRGYIFGRPGHLFHQLGPLVAEDRATAQDLIAHCCSELEGRRLGIDAPQFDSEWVAWLASVGFVAERPFVRMFREGDRHPGLRALQYAVTGPEFA